MAVAITTTNPARAMIATLEEDIPTPNRTMDATTSMATVSKAALAPRIVPLPVTDWVSRFSDEITRDVSVFRHVHMKSAQKSRLPEGHWFYMEVSPLSSRPERVAQVLSDLLNSCQEIEAGKNGCILPVGSGPSWECTLSEKDKEILKHIKPKTFKVVMWEGSPRKEEFESYNYPVFFVLQPEINHAAYPYHPHLNPITRSFGIMLPESICYELDFSGLGVDEYERATASYVMLCTWLFRHQVWEARYGDQLLRWPGDQVETAMNQIVFCRERIQKYGRHAAVTQNRMLALFEL